MEQKQFLDQFFLYAFSDRLVSVQNYFVIYFNKNCLSSDVVLTNPKDLGSPSSQPELMTLPQVK